MKKSGTLIILFMIALTFSVIVYFRYIYNDSPFIENNPEINEVLESGNNPIDLD
ncbi:MAG: hypothetical protein GF368_04205, partial [Candidatus Aenigmarchaeota archaeon]|nr:hypothetical protein [Candidatus Aenigmarchaeota archaeon]